MKELDQYSFFKYLEYSVDSSDLQQLAASILKEDGVSYAIAAFGPKLSYKLFGDDSISKNELKMPSTPTDLFIWIQGNEESDVLTRAQEIDSSIPAEATLELEQDGFFQEGTQDFRGFIDGSANPEDQDVLNTAIIKLGESKTNKIILTPKQASSDVLPVRNNELKKVSPFGDLKEDGVYFLAFSCEERSLPHIVQNVDNKEVDLSAAETGSYFYAPSLNQLKKIC